jgi:hypothetical protein
MNSDLRRMPYIHCEFIIFSDETIHTKLYGRSDNCIVTVIIIRVAWTVFLSEISVSNIAEGQLTSS